MGRHDRARGLEPVEAPVRCAMVLVCEKCGRRLADDDDADPDENVSRRFQKALKRDLATEFGKHEARAIASGCFDLCPPYEVAVAVCDLAGGTTFYRFDPEDGDAARRALVEKVRAMVRPR